MAATSLSSYAAQDHVVDEIALPARAGEPKKSRPTAALFGGCFDGASQAFLLADVSG